ncbi:MAG: hypothetical protein KME20_22170 [Kaiparowitsia implicata GSE-PSE-MK54-09C]|nr:hypothetical protein [Kaiparowitsia implicata GSE-PSE-MK54-09C]
MGLKQRKTLLLASRAAGFWEFAELTSDGESKFWKNACKKAHVVISWMNNRGFFINAFLLTESHFHKKAPGRLSLFRLRGLFLFLTPVERIL